MEEVVFVNMVNEEVNANSVEEVVFVNMVYEKIDAKSGETSEHGQRSTGSHEKTLEYLTIKP